MSSTISPNMNLIVPTVGQEPGPNYALDVNNSLSLIDQHDHSPGKGVQINPAGIDINAALAFNGNNATSMGAVVFNSISPITTIQALYVAPGVESPADQDLWFNDGNGNAVQITSGGLVNATIASLPGESYSGGTFFWKQGALSTTPANFDIGSITLRPNVAATTFGVTLSPPSGISSAFNQALPALPVSVISLMSMDTSGNMYANTTVDGTTLQIVSNVISVKTVSSGNIAAGAVGTSQIAANAVTYAKIDPTILEWNNSIYSSAGTYSFTTPAGVNKLYIVICGAGGGGGAGARVSTHPGAGGGGGGGSSPIQLFIDTSPGNTYSVVVGAGGTGGTGGASNPGGSGVAGGASYVWNGISTYYAYALGGNGGSGGNNSTGGSGGAGPSLTSILSLNQTAGGAGGSGLTGGSAGGVSLFLPNNPAAAGGTGGSNSQAGGGGGGAGLFAGGAGGAGANNVTTGPNGGNGNSGAGGGGSGGSSADESSASGNGGNGGDGYVAIYYIGNP